jgi:hypothetical protein
MPLQIAILFTGQIRTLLKTIENFKKNILTPNTDHIIHIYTCLEYPEVDNLSITKSYQQEIQSLFYDHFGKNIFTTPIQWISSKDALCKFVRDKIVQSLTIHDHWKDYLGNRSGSITEYYQLYKGFEQIEHYESQTNTKYDFFIRTRCDISISHPLQFTHFQYSPEQIIERFSIIQQTFPQHSIAHCIALYLTSIPQPIENAISRITTPKFTLEILYDQTSPSANTYARFLNPTHPENPILSIHEIAEFIQQLLPSIRLTYRQNLFYMGFIGNKQNEKDIILNYRYLEEKRIKYTYSYNQSERTIEGENSFWFNAENIYQKNVIEKGFVIVNSYTEFEEKSLYDNEKCEDTSIFLLRRE